MPWSQGFPPGAPVSLWSADLKVSDGAHDLAQQFDDISVPPALRWGSFVRHEWCLWRERVWIRHPSLHSMPHASLDLFSSVLVWASTPYIFFKKCQSGSLLYSQSSLPSSFMALHWSLRTVKLWIQSRSHKINKICRPMLFRLHGHTFRSECKSVSQYLQQYLAYLKSLWILQY